jgi:hypothetical protein
MVDSNPRTATAVSSRLPLNELAVLMAKRIVLMAKRIVLTML